jgi:hypothetical protein
MEPLNCAEPADDGTARVVLQSVLAIALTAVSLAGCMWRRQQQQPERRLPARVMRLGDPPTLEGTLCWNRMKQLPCRSERLALGIEFLSLARTFSEEQRFIAIWQEKALGVELPTLEELAEGLTRPERWQRQVTRYFHGTNMHYGREMWRDAACGRPAFDAEDRPLMERLCKQASGDRSTYGLGRILQSKSIIWVGGQVQTPFEYMGASPEWFEDLVGANFHDRTKEDAWRHLSGQLQADGLRAFFEKYWERFCSDDRSALVILQRKELGKLPPTNIPDWVEPNFRVNEGLDPALLLPPRVYSVGPELRAHGADI